MNRACLALLCLACLPAAAAPVSLPGVPANLEAPEDQVVLLKALGKGKQVYVCKAKAGDASQFEWTLERPDADLTGEDGARIGKHYAGPTWEAADGSRVTGQVQQRADAPDRSAIP